MMNNNVLKAASWCSLASAVSMFLAMVFFLIAPMVGGILEILFLLLLIFVFYTLYLFHRAESAGLSLAGLVLLKVAITIDIVSMQNYGNILLSNLWYTFFSLPFLVFDFLAFRSSQMPRGLFVLALLTGAFYLISGVGGFFAGPDFADRVSLISILTLLAWLIWLWRVFRTGKLASATS